MQQFRKLRVHNQLSGKTIETHINARSQDVIVFKLWAVLLIAKRETGCQPCKIKYTASNIKVPAVFANLTGI